MTKEASGFLTSSSAATVSTNWFSSSSSGASVGRGFEPVFCFLCERVAISVPECNSSFNRLVVALEAPVRHYGDQIPLKGVTNKHGWFKLWPGSVGAKHPPQKRIPLDYRLRDSQFFKSQIMDVLMHLERTLQKGELNVVNGTPLGLPVIF